MKKLFYKQVKKAIDQNTCNKKIDTCIHINVNNKLKNQCKI